MSGERRRGRWRPWIWAPPRDLEPRAGANRGATLIRRALLAAIVVGSCAQRASAPTQPIPFNHKLHLEVELDGRPLGCTDCHAGADKAEHAGLPALPVCLRCHMRPQGGEDGEPSEQEQRVRTLAAAGGPFRWIQVTRNPGHVYASHRAHVGIAKLECETCHGDVSSWTAPPTRPNEALTKMTLCMDCHRRRGAPNVCGTCHR